MRNKRSAGALAALFIVLLGCFLMPSYVSGISDRNTLDRLIVIDAKGISFEASPDLSIADRLRLIANPGREAISLKNGKALTEREAERLLFGELARFLDTSASGLPELVITEVAALFVIDSEDPTINMIAWEFSLSGADGTTWKVVLDEETGLILHIYYREAGSAATVKSYGADQLYSEAKRLSKLIGTYYGMEAELQYELINGLGFYNVQLDYDGDVVVMYGIVRATGFTVNE